MTGLGRRPDWLRILLVASSPYVSAIVLPEGSEFELVDPVVLHFTHSDPAEDPIQWTAAATAPDRVTFLAEPEAVNEVIELCSAGSRRARITLGNEVWMDGFFEIDGVW